MFEEEEEVEEDGGCDVVEMENGFLVFFLGYESGMLYLVVDGVWILFYLLEVV